MSTRRHIKQELADPRSSPTIPNTSSRAQTISSTAETPIANDSSITRDSPTARDTSFARDSPIARDSPTAQEVPMELHGASPDSQATMANGSQNGHDDHDALKSLGAHSYRLIQGIKKLEELKISATLKSLPKFVVVGDQSAGKSSIVEALCDISLPRSMGTCTRCPFSITTSAHGPTKNDGAWSCSISIKEGFFFDKGSFKRRVGDPVVTHFANVTNKERLEPMLRNAQLAVLNPRENPQQFINADEAQATRQVAFSPNIVCLEIQGPGLPELSFFDLPGTINVVGEEDDPEDQGLVQRISKLVTTFLMDEKSLVLLACGADQDVETSTTFRLIKDCKATARCVGVLTKADLMPPGKNEYIQKILDGNKFALGKGWFITKQLSQKQIDQGITHASARDLEAEFFSSQPWAQDHCGIPQLQDAISRFLTQHIHGELPEILERVGNRLSEITHQLTFYPERPNHPTSIVIQEVTQIAGIISAHVKGDDHVNPFRKAIEAVIKSFKQNLLDVKPSLDFKTPGYKAPSISLDSDDEPETPTPSRTQMPVRPLATPQAQPSRKRPAVDTPTRRQQRIKPDPAGPTLERPVHTLDFLRDTYEQGNTSGIPGFINAKVTKKLILSALESWTAAVTRLLENAEQEVLSTVQKAADDQLSNRTSTQLFTKSREILAGFVVHHMAEARDRITWLCRCEQEKPITYSKWASTKMQRQRELEFARKVQRVNEYFETREATNNLRAATPREKRVEKARDDAWVAKELGDDEWAEEVKNAANIFAYYDTASTCFVDTVAKCLEFGVMAPLRDEVQNALLNNLHVEDAAACTLLLAEDPERERQRTKLLAEQAKLVEAIAELKGLQG